MRRWLVRIGLALGGILVVLAAVAWTALGTTAGARFVLDRVLPDGVAVDRVEGRLWGSLTLHDVTLETPSAAVRVARVAVRWRPGRLLGRTLEVQRIAVDSVNAELREAPAEAETQEDDSAAGRPRVPVRVLVHDLGVRHVRVVTVAGDTATMDSALTALSARADTFIVDSVRVHEVRFQGSRVSAQASGRVVTGADGADTAAVRLAWQGETADGRRLAGRGGVVGGAGEYLLTQELLEPVSADLRGTVRSAWSPDSLRWEATLELPRTALSVVQADLAGEVGGTVEASGSTTAVRADLRASGSYPGAGEAAVTARLGFQDRVLTVDTLELARSDAADRAARGSRGVVRGAGRVEFTDSVPAADVELAWTDLPLGWPLDSAATSSPTGSLRFTGAPAQFEARTTLSLRSPERSFGEWSVQATGSYADTLVARVAYQGVVPELPAFRGDGRVRYATDRLVIPELDLRVRGRGRAVLTGRVALADEPRGEAVLRWSDVAWPQEGHPDGFRSPTGRVAVRGALSAFSLTGSADFTGWSAPPSRLEVSLDGSADSTRVALDVRGSGVAEGVPAVDFSTRLAYRFDDRYLVADTVDLRLPETGGRLAGGLELDLADPGRRARGRVRWSDLGWPVHDPAYWSDDGEATLEGAAGEVRVALSSHLGGTELPDSRWRLVGAGDPLGRFAVDTLRGELLGGELEGAGVVWNETPRRWELTLRGRDLDPGAWRAEWPGSVAFGLRTDGELGDTLRYAVTVDSVAGTLRSRRLDGAARVRGVGDRVAVDTLWITSDGSSVAAAGTVADSLELAWRIDAPRLADLQPYASGRMVADGTVSGPRANPAVRFDGAGDSLAARGWTVGRLRAEGAVDLADTSSLRASVRGLAGPSLALDSLFIDGSGTRAEHQVALAAHAPTDLVRARLAGGLEADVWDGTLRELLLQSGQAGEWRLRAPAALTVGRDSGRVGELCWEGAGELCLAGSWSPAGVQWRGSGEALPMAFFRPVLPQAVTLRGNFALDTEGSLAPGRAPIGTFRFSGEAGRVEYNRDIGQTVTQPYDGFAVTAESDSAGVRADLELLMGTLGSVRADARLPGGIPIMDRTLDGSMTARINDDGTVARFVESVTRTHGVVTAEVDISGMARSPRFDGRVTVDSLAATVVPAGIRLRDGRLTARSTEEGRWTFEGGIRSDTGSIALTGSARPPTADSAWQVQAGITGQRFRAFQTPELLVSASPDLQVFARPDSIHVGGALRIPRGRVTVRQFENTVSASPDVVIMEGETPEETPAGEGVMPAQVWADVRLVLGDSVTIDALGLTGRLDGQLSVTAQPTRPPVGSGELRIIDGRYRIYRQTFQIDRGRLLYASTPLTDPALDLRVTRSRNSVTAGMEISGRATDPRVQLFSEPTLSDEEILSYLLIGRPLRQLSQSEGSQVQNAAQAIGVAGGNLLLARLSSVFGLETARIERTTTQTGEGGTQRETNIVLGRQILPRVHLDYVIGLTGAANVLRLRYMITDHWILQTETGEETGADLLYSIER